jgi:hypothetical protein
LKLSSKERTSMTKPSGKKLTLLCSGYEMQIKNPVLNFLTPRSSLLYEYIIYKLKIEFDVQGHDTTAATASFTIFLLGTHPEAQVRNNL